jgi:hypothetical protein
MVSCSSNGERVYAVRKLLQDYGARRYFLSGASELRN